MTDLEIAREQTNTFSDREEIDMTPIELIAYRMKLRNGTIDQLWATLQSIIDLEPTLPSELMAAIIDMLRQRYAEVSSHTLTRYICKLLGKTQSSELYRVADEIGCLTYLDSKTFVNKKVNLFVSELFYQSDIEKLAIDELYLWINYIEQTIRMKYLDPRSLNVLESPDYDPRLKSSIFSVAPIIPIGRLLAAFDKIASPQGRESLLALEYLFRPLLNDYLMVEQKWAAEYDIRAVALEKGLDDGGLGDTDYATPTVFILRDILDCISRIARSKPQAKQLVQTND